MYPEFNHETRNNSDKVIEKSKLKLSFITRHSTKVISTFDYETAASIYMRAQGAFKGYGLGFTLNPGVNA